MALTYSLIIFFAAAIITAGAYFANKKITFLPLLRKIIALGIVPIAFYRYLVEHEAVMWIRGLNMTLIPGYEIPFGDEVHLTIIAIFLIWFTWAALLSVILNEFFKIDTLANIVKFFSVPIFLLDILLFEIYATGIIGKGAMNSGDPRLICITVELILALSLGLSSVLTENTKLPNRDATLRMLKSLPFAILAIIPCYVPQALIGYLDQSVKIEDFTEAHRLVLYFSIIIPFLIFHALKDKTYEVKRFAMIYMTLGLMWSYLAYWQIDQFSSIKSWPLHLCNTAMFIIPLCLIFKWDKLFNFCLFINVMGAFLAMTMPNTDTAVNALAFERVNYWINHYPAFFMPVLLISLKLFKRPKFKEWIYSQVAFACYFVLVLFLNAWFGDTDFFFLNGDFIVDKLGDWAEAIKDIEWHVELMGRTMVFYPLYQFLFYLVYVAISAGMWFLYALLFEIWDKAEDRRLRERDYKKMEKDFKEFLGERSIDKPLSGDGSPSLVLKEFSKKYGANKHYSVDHASFNVKGGEIFGFLGPNGAGKSTIIKSIVGIQTITSGNIEVCGFDVEKQSVQAKLNLGFVPDHYALYENLTGREYINYVADLYSVSREERDESIERMVTRFQLQGAFDNQMKTYSHGMKQKIAIMAALVHNPKVWILDEPLTGLDPTSIHEVKECMKEHAAKGNIVFFSSHIIDVVEKICDKIAIIRKGKIRAAASLKELEARKMDLEQFYLDIISAEEGAPLVSIDGDDILGITVSDKVGGDEA
ncbi:MAG: YwaF family protein [Clostridia bacterium]|nr:YwaF family protein [Clostridia bacterium]